MKCNSESCSSVSGKSPQLRDTGFQTFGRSGRISHCPTDDHLSGTTDFLGVLVCPVIVWKCVTAVRTLFCLRVWRWRCVYIYIYIYTHTYIHTYIHTPYILCVMWQLQTWGRCESLTQLTNSVSQNLHVVRSSVQVNSDRGKGKAAVVHAMKAYGESAGIAPRMLNLGTRRRWSASRLCHFSPGESAFGTRSIGDCVGPRANLDVVGKWYVALSGSGILDRPASCLVSMPVTLFGLSKWEQQQYNNNNDNNNNKSTELKVISLWNREIG